MNINLTNNITIITAVAVIMPMAADITNNLSSGLYFNQIISLGVFAAFGKIC